MAGIEGVIGERRASSVGAANQLERARARAARWCAWAPLSPARPHPAARAPARPCPAAAALARPRAPRRPPPAAAQAWSARTSR